MSKTLFKSIGAVLIGFLAIALLSTGTDFILEKTGVFPSIEAQIKYGSSTWLLATALIYRSIYAIIGGYITAKLSPNYPMRHVIILAVIGTILGILGTIANWDKTTPGSEWYPILLMLSSPFTVWFGGKLKANKI